MPATKRASLLFDVDNTLIDRDAAFRDYIQHFIDRHQDAFGDEDREQVRDDMLAMDAHGRKDRQLFCRQLLETYPQLPHTEESLWQDHLSLPDFVQADHVLQEMLARLTREYQLMIISNGSGTMQRRKLQQAGLTEIFEHIFISAEVGYAKPDQRLFSHALRHCDHEKIIMIGDDYINDMQPAMAMQLKTVFINPANVVVPAKPDSQLRSIHALEEVLTCMI